MTAPIVPPSRLDAIVLRIREAQDFPAFSRVMTELMASFADEGASAQRLANLVLRDYALSLRVIRVANTVHYNRTGRPVQSATHALMLLGNSAVRDLACGILLFEHYRGRSPGLKELMLLSLLTASHARVVAERAGLRDLEAVQLCAMFRNLGEVLVAAHLPKEYAEVLTRTKELAEREQRTGGRRPPSALRAQATSTTLGCTFEDVGVSIAQHWGMPVGVRAAMRSVGAAGEELTEVAVAFAHSFTTAVYREGHSSREEAARSLGTFSKKLQLTRENVAAGAEAAVADTREIFEAAGVALDDLRLVRQLERALAEAPPRDGGAEASRAAGTAAGHGLGAAVGAAVGGASGDAAGSGATGGGVALAAHGAAPTADGTAPVAPPAAAMAPGTTADGGSATVRRPGLVDAALAEARDRYLSDLENATHEASDDRVVLVALEAALRGGPFDRAALCVPEMGAGGGLSHLAVRIALGEDPDGLRPRLRSATEPRGPLAAAVAAGEELLLTRTGRLTGAEEGLLRAWQAGAVLLLPVTIALSTGRRGRVWLHLERTGGTRVDAPTLAWMRRLAGTIGRVLVTRRPATPGQGAGVNMVGRLTGAVPSVSGPAEAVGPVAGTDARAGGGAPVAGAAHDAAADAGTVPSAQHKAAAVLRVLRGEPVAAVAAEVGVPAPALESWHREFLEGALARLGG